MARAGRRAGYGVDVVGHRCGRIYRFECGRGLNEAGRADIAVNDFLGSEGKWRNLGKRQIADFVPPKDLFAWLEGRKLEAVIHLGAISDTTATDGDLVMDTNFRLSMRLLDWCTATKTPLIYASSAATYGEGHQGFVDDGSLEALRALRPMNLYGWSKHLFDLAGGRPSCRRREKMPPQWAGLKFFNVFGPNEYHKGAMASVLCKVFDEAKSGKPVRLFKSHREGHRRRRSAPRLYLCRRHRCRDALAARDTVGQRHFQRRYRQGAQLSKDMIVAMFAAMGASPISNTSTCRDRSAASISISRKATSAICAARVTMRASRRLKKRSANTYPAISTRPIVTGKSRKHVRSRKKLQETRKLAVLCIGDLMLDDFVYGEVSRISPEAPAPVIAVQREEIVIGGAGNVARNIAALGAKCIFLGIVGNDEAGAVCRASFKKYRKGIVPNLVSDPTRPTTRKLRFVSEHFSTHLLRADWEEARPATGSVEKGTHRARPKGLAASRTRWCCPDYAKGVLTEKGHPRRHRPRRRN
jgi:ADP-L-glycero-D-manno-heptose 6-epimerase